MDDQTEFEKNYLYNDSNTQAGRFPCPNNCGRYYRHKRNVWRHYRFECGVEKEFQCSICRKKFRHKAQLNSHLVAVHRVIP